MTDAAAPLKRAALVYNPIKVDALVLRASVERLSTDAGWGEPHFYETTVEDLGQGPTRQAIAEGASAVLVAGGDGTVRAVAEAMTGTGVPLTIVPSGTGNLLARNVNLPLTDPEAMIRATFEGDIHPMDVGMAHVTRTDGTDEEHGFVVMAARRALSAASALSTRSDDSPRDSCERLTSSGFSRRSTGSITRQS